MSEQPSARVEATYELPDRFVIVYDYVPGDTLAHIVEENGRLAPNVAVQLIGQVCEAVQELHQHGVIHRDITPANIIVAQDGAHLIDFGIARIQSASNNRSRDTTALGTYGFASPEQYGFAKTDARSDVFSLGRLLGFMLTGAYPDDNNYDKLLNDNAIVTPHLRAVISHACAFEPSQRPQSVPEFHQMLFSATDSAAVSTQLPSDAQRATRNARTTNIRSPELEQTRHRLMVRRRRSTGDCGHCGRHHLRRASRRYRAGEVARFLNVIRWLIIERFRRGKR